MWISSRLKTCGRIENSCEMSDAEKRRGVCKDIHQLLDSHTRDREEVKRSER